MRTFIQQSFTEPLLYSCTPVLCASLSVILVSMNYNQLGNEKRKIMIDQHIRYNVRGKKKTGGTSNPTCVVRIGCHWKRVKDMVFQFYSDIHERKVEAPYMCVFSSIGRRSGNSAGRQYGLVVVKSTRSETKLHWVQILVLPLICYGNFSQLTSLHLSFRNCQNKDSNGIYILKFL